MTGRIATALVALLMAGAPLGAQQVGQGMAIPPGLRGKDATEQESAELLLMFHRFDTLGREVELLPDGIRTRTFSSDPEVMEALVSHVIGMIDRVEMGRDPQIGIQSPTLDIFFVRHDRILTDIDIESDAIVVTQTSDDPEMVEALHIHAGEVSAMAARGMAAVHEMIRARQADE